MQSAPKVVIEKPKMDALFAGPATITIEAKAYDQDGTIKQVEFLDNGESIGLGKSSDGENFVLTKADVAFGPHSLLAVATDNEGLSSTSNAANIFVNGPSQVSMINPKEGALLAPDTDITLTALATDLSGILKVQFYFNEELLGQGEFTASNEYSMVLKGSRRAAYRIEAVVTNTAGLKTFSLPVRFTVSDRPKIKMLRPTSGSRSHVGSNVSVMATANQPGGNMQKVDFYANGKLIGKAYDNGTDQFLITWRNVQRGTYHLVAVGTDELGVTAKSDKVLLTVESPNGRRGR